MKRMEGRLSLSREPLHGFPTCMASALTASPKATTVQTVYAPRDQAWIRTNIPCQAACPAGTDIPGYLEAIYQGEFTRAYEINLRGNVFPGVLGRVCSRPCESACRHGRPGNGEPVAICASKRAASDYRGPSVRVLPPLYGPSGKTVAIVGAGVAGMAAARELARLGHDVTVFEKHYRPGGMLNQGIPAFRLPREIIDQETEQIQAHGVKIRCGIDIGTDMPLEELLENFDAVVMAAGALMPNLVAVQGADLCGVEHGIKFLREVNEFGRKGVGAKTIVIGGGYTAMDCARTALRLDASVDVYYRRARQDMVVLPGELEELLAEGGRMHTQCAPVEFLGNRGRLEGVRFIRTKQSEPGPDGYRKLVEVHGSEFDVPAESAILATGQYPFTRWIGPELGRLLLSDDERLRGGRSVHTSVRKLFAAGDFAIGSSTLIEAIAHAKDAAMAVDEWLAADSRLERRIRVEGAGHSKSRESKTTGRTPAMNYIPLHPVPALPPDDRSAADEVELGYSRAVARDAAARCYLCHYKFEIIDEKCVLCDECMLVKPVDGCIVRISALLKDESDVIVGYETMHKSQTSSLYYNRLWIDQDKCIRCGACEKACPVNAITLQKVSYETVVSGPVHREMPDAGVKQHE